MANGAVAVTVNRRLSRTLRKQYDQAQVDAGRLAWPAPHMLPWDAWLNQLFQQLRCIDNEPWQLLNSAQSLCLWEQVLAESDIAESLLNVTAAASLAQSAWAIQHNWGVNPANAHLSGDQLAYTQWARSYQRRCERSHWLDSASLINWLAARITDIKPLPSQLLPTQLLVLGFDTLSPAHTALLEVLRCSGVQVAIDDLPGVDRHNAVLLACEDEYQEGLAAVNWACSQLRQNADCTIGIVVPDLAVRRTALLQALDQTLEPDSALIPMPPVSPHYNISLGKPLGEYPMVGDALRWLGLMCRPQPLEQCTQLILSAYLGLSDAERLHCAQADVQLRRMGGSRFSLHALARALRQYAPGGFCARLDKLIALCDTLPPRQCCSAWSQCIEALLACIGWPGEVGLSSEEFQLHGAWRQILQALAGFDTVSPLCSFSVALEYLGALARNNVFQVESQSDARLQIVGLLEVAGMQFDALWVMGMDEQRWPPRPQLNPFLPLAMQRSAHIPHSTAAWEVDFARRSMLRLSSSAGRVIFSYAGNEGDTPIAPSPLVADRPLCRVTAEVAGCYGPADLQPVDLEPLLPEPVYHGPAYELQAQAGHLNRLDDSVAPARQPGLPVRGGVTVLSDQAECPFRAFARHRLRAEPLDEPHTGVSASERGSILHTAMEFLWRALQSQSKLLSLGGDALKTLIDEAINHAIQKVYGTVSNAFITLERGHLAGLIDSWLKLEKNRPAFQIDSLEQAHVLVIGGLSLELRIDRVDKLETDAYLLIDYKTGKPQAQDWMKTRPGDVQLPLYTLAYAQPVGALALAYVRPQQSTFAGVSADETGLSGIKLCSEKFRRQDALQFQDWTALQQHWRTEITTLAEEFVGGTASVTPRALPQTCAYCALDPLCRVGSQAVVNQADTDQGNDE